MQPLTKLLSQPTQRSLLPDITHQSLSELMLSLSQGEQKAFAQFYDQTSQPVYAFLLRILKQPTMAEEVLLDVYLQTWQQATSYDPARGSVLAWLMTMARSRAIDRLRSSGWQWRENEDLTAVSQALATEDDSLEAASLLSERGRMVRAAMAQLSPQQRVLIETAYFEGLSLSEIALHFGLPLGTVKTHIRSGMLILHQHLSVLAQ